MTKSPLPRRTYSIAEVCQVYGVCRQTVHNLRKSGRLQAREVGRRVFISVDSCEEVFRGPKLSFEEAHLKAMLGYIHFRGPSETPAPAAAVNYFNPFAMVPLLSPQLDREDYDRLLSWFWNQDAWPGGSMGNGQSI